jgi:hypothetical protein
LPPSEDTGFEVPLVTGGEVVEVSFGCEIEFLDDVLTPLEGIVFKELLSNDPVVSGCDVITASVLRQEQAEEIRELELLHCETYGGRPVEAVLIVVVYVAQK